MDFRISEIRLFLLLCYPLLSMIIINCSYTILYTLHHLYCFTIQLRYLFGHQVSNILRLKVLRSIQDSILLSVVLIYSMIKLNKRKSLSKKHKNYRKDSSCKIALRQSNGLWLGWDKPLKNYQMIMKKKYMRNGNWTQIQMMKRIKILYIYDLIL